MQSKLEHIAYTFLVLGWFIGCQWLVAYVITLLIKPYDLSYTALYGQHMYKVNLFIQILCLAGMVFLQRAAKRKRNKLLVSFQKERLIIYILYGIGLWFLTTLFNLFAGYFFSDYAKEVRGLFTSPEPYLRFAVIVLAAPILEEYVFRGVIQDELQQGFNVWWAAVLQGIIFGLIHPFALQKIYAAILGVVLGLIKEKEQNLHCVMIIHMMINLIGFIIGTLQVQ